MTTILVGTDTSAAADLAVKDAARLARERDGKLVVLYVRPDGDLRAVVDPGKAADPGRYLASMAGRFPEVPTTTRMEDGDPADRIVAVAEEERADTIVLGEPRHARVLVAGARQRPQPGAASRAVQRVHRGHAAGPVRVRRARSHGGTRAPPSPGGGRPVPP